MKLIKKENLIKKKMEIPRKKILVVNIPSFRNCVRYKLQILGVSFLKERRNSYYR